MLSTIILGNSCNFNCKYCFEKHKDNNATIRFDYIKAYMEKVYGEDNPFDIQPDEDNIVNFIGGESFLYPKLIDRTIELHTRLSKKYGYKKPKYEVETNGYNIDSEEVQQLLKKYPKMLVIFSIDGNKKSHDTNRVLCDGSGTFDKVWQNWLNTKRYYKTIRWTLNANTTSEYYETIKSWIDNGDRGTRFDVFLNWDDSDFATYGWKTFSEQVTKLIGWYKNHTAEWVTNHYYPVSQAYHKARFMKDLDPYVRCKGKRCALDFDGTVIKCIKNSLVTRSDRDNFSLYGHIKDIENVDWARCAKLRLASEMAPADDNDRCYGCPIGSMCTSCFVGRNTQTIEKHCCNMHAIKHLEKVFFVNYYRKACLSMGIEPFVPPQSILIAECWAVEVLGKEMYDYLSNLTLEVGGSVTPLKTKSVSREDINILIELKKEEEEV